jgi:hypothetical protein
MNKIDFFVPGLSNVIADVLAGAYYREANFEVSLKSDLRLTRGIVQLER